MKTLIIILLSLAQYAHGQSVDQLDIKGGFRSYKLGSFLKDNPRLVKRYSTSNEFFDDPFDTLKIGEYEIKSLIYSFYDNRLISIRFNTTGFSNSRGVLSVLQKAYGPGSKSNQHIEEYYWVGKRVVMVYDENSITNDATIIIYDVELTDKKAADKDAKERKAADGL